MLAPALDKKRERKRRARERSPATVSLSPSFGDADGGRRRGASRPVLSCRVGVGAITAVQR